MASYALWMLLTARATILAIREREYVLASRAVGASTPRIMLRHVLLNAVDPLIVLRGD